jgi:hypothetical protein
LLGALLSCQLSEEALRVADGANVWYLIEGTDSDRERREEKAQKSVKKRETGEERAQEIGERSHESDRRKGERERERGKREQNDKRESSRQR